MVTSFPLAIKTIEGYKLVSQLELFLRGVVGADGGGH